MQPPTENPNPAPNINPTEPQVPATETAPVSTPEVSQPQPAQTPMTQPVPQSEAAGASIVAGQPVPATPIVQPMQTTPPAPVPQQPVMVLPVAGPAPTVIGAQPVAQTSTVSSLAPSAPNVGGANLPGAPNSGTMFIGGDTGLQTVAASGTTRLAFASSKRKKVMIAGGSGVGVALALVLFVFGFYVPNKPENVWRTGMDRTGDQMTAMITKLEDPKALAQLEKSKITAQGSIDLDGQKATLSLDTKADDTKSDSTAQLNATISGMPEIAITAALKTQLPDNALLPNLYFKVSGIGELGLDGFIPGISAYENKWIAVEQDFLKQFESTLSSQTTASAQPMTQADIVSIAKDVNAVSQEYIFTSDPEKAVIQLDEFIATEESEGIKANHYKAKLDTDNLAEYCTALGDTLLKNEAVKDNDLLGGIDAAEIKRQCDTAGDDLATNKFDLWMDKKHKLFHKVRFSEDLDAQAEKIEEDKQKCIADFRDNPDPQGLASDAYCSYNDDMIETGEIYTEFGQVYKGDDTFELFMNAIEDTNKSQSDARIELTVNAKDLTIDGNMSFSTKSEYVNMEGELTIETEPYDGEIDASKPTDAIPIQQVIDALTNTQPATEEPEYSFMSGLSPVTSQLNMWKNWLQ